MFTCNICCDEFDDTLKCILDCNFDHYFCKDCITNKDATTASNNNNNNRGRGRRGRGRGRNTANNNEKLVLMKTCPFCRQVIKSSVPNRIANSTIESIIGPEL